MEFLMEEEIQKDLENLKEMLEEIDVSSDIFEKGNLFDQKGLLIILSEEKENISIDWENMNNTSFAVTFPMELEEKALRKYIITYTIAAENLDIENELMLYQLLNYMNKMSNTGKFYLEQEKESENYQIYYSFRIGSKVGENTDEVLFGEAVLHMIMECNIIKDFLEDIKENRVPEDYFRIKAEE